MRNRYIKWKKYIIIYTNSQHAEQLRIQCVMYNFYSICRTVCSAEGTLADKGIFCLASVLLRAQHL